MSIQQNLDDVTADVHTLATAEVIDNTFGLICNIQRGLQSIQRQMTPVNAGATLGQETADRLRELVTRIIDNELLLFGIPEKWLRDSVMAAAKEIQRRLKA
jgi:hypothetical protein